MEEAEDSRMTQNAITATTTSITVESQELLLRAQDGDLTCLPELRAALDENQSLWKDVGDLAQHAELCMLRQAAGNNLLAIEAMKRKLHELKHELGGSNPPPLER